MLAIESCIGKCADGIALSSMNVSLHCFVSCFPLNGMVDPKSVQMFAPLFGLVDILEDFSTFFLKEVIKRGTKKDSFMVFLFYVEGLI